MDKELKKYLRNREVNVWRRTVKRRKINGTLLMKKH
jgi:hypothetical protein